MNYQSLATWLKHLLKTLVKGDFFCIPPFEIESTQTDMAETVLANGMSVTIEVYNPKFANRKKNWWVVVYMQIF